MIDVNSSPHAGEQDNLAAETVVGWQPIETAPRDGTWILMYRAHDIAQARRQIDVFSKNKEWGGIGWAYGDDAQPTHWIPLPAPPTDATPAQVVPQPERDR